MKIGQLLIQKQNVLFPTTLNYKIKEEPTFKNNLFIYCGMTKKRLKNKKYILFSLSTNKTFCFFEIGNFKEI